MIRLLCRDGAEAFRHMGGKAYRLARMKELGFPVPGFICITAEEAGNGAAVRAALAEACPGVSRFAVRSSASVEDGGDHSYAGQFATYLRVPPEALEERIAACVASGEQANVRAYGQRFGAPEVRMCVLIQAMVEPELSGVVFTANPLGIRSETVLVVGRGDGAAVVTDRTDTTTYYYNRPDGQSYTQGGPEAPTLPRRWLERLVELGTQLEETFGPGLDLEYAVADDALWLLQLRPITTLSGEPPVVLDNSNIVESYPGITLPLTLSFIHRVYGDIFAGLLRRLSGGDALVRRAPQVFREMVADYNGRAYYHINHWYAVLRLLPFSRRIIPVWQEMLGVTDRELPGGTDRVSWRTKLAILWNAARLLWTVPRKMEGLEDDFAAMSRAFQANYRPGLDSGALWELYDHMNRRVFRQWDLTLANDMYAFVYTALLRGALRRRGCSEERINSALTHITQLASLAPVRALIQLALLYRQEGESPAFLSAFADYIQAYGDRSVGELKLETQTYRERPELLMDQVKSYAQTQGLEEILNRLEQPEEPIQGGPVLRLLARRAALGTRYRESSRLNRSRLYGFARRIFLDLGAGLAQQGKLDEARDVFYLTMEELAEAGGREDLRALVAGRKGDYARYETFPAYRRVVFAGTVRNKAGTATGQSPPEADAGWILQGVSCSAGTARGPVLVITDPAGVYDTRGKILVTASTDPGWVFWLAQAAGVVSEKGSLLSHTAIVARELNLPAIVGVPQATRRLQDGELVELDCESGQVRRVGETP